MASAGGAAADGVAVAPPVAARRPVGPADGELVLWEGRPGMGATRSFELAALAVLLTLLGWLAVELILPHFRGSEFAGNPDQSALPLILVMLIGMMAVIALPVWLRIGTRGRARYMLTNRRALVWLGDRVIGEAVLLGADVAVARGGTVEFGGTLTWLDWRLKDEAADRLRFERIADADAVATLAERQGARRAVESE